jgi:toxin ParE1/3/4
LGEAIRPAKVIVVEHKRVELSPPVRIHPVQSHLVIYQIEDDGSVLIIRVRHVHEDWADPLTDK